MAQQADIHELYEEAVQAVDGEIEYLVDTFKNAAGPRRDQLPRGLLRHRERFLRVGQNRCGGTAVGVDIDESVLDWGRAIACRAAAGGRARARQAAARRRHDVVTEPVDVAVAFNFSYFFVQDARRAAHVFRPRREALNDDGLFFLDVFGGFGGASSVQKEKTKLDGFTYVWDQARDTSRSRIAWSAIFTSSFPTARS
jgi:SAM-dependent methyltransferase